MRFKEHHEAIQRTQDHVKSLPEYYYVVHGDINFIFKRTTSGWYKLIMVKHDNPGPYMHKGWAQTRRTPISQSTLIQAYGEDALTPIKKEELKNMMILGQI